MNKNQKIAIGCGAVGCLGLIVICIGVAGFLYWRSQQVAVRASERGPFNFNANSNANSNSNSNSNSNTDSDSNDNSNSNGNESSTNSSPGNETSSYSEDEKHRLFHAAGMSGDPDLMAKVFKKIGIWTNEGVPGPGYQQFNKEHISWTLSNTGFLVSIDTPEKAKAYIESHL
jgi:hypothetical protein